MPRKLALLAAAAAAFTVLLTATASAFTFGAPQTRVAGLAAQEMGAVAAADVDGDGLLDAVASGFSSSAPGGDSVIAVLRGRANGTLAPAANYPLTGTGPATGIGVGDFNEDGAPDAVTGNVFGEEIAVSLNDGEGGYLPPITVAAGGFGPASFVVADFNADEDLDVASLNSVDTYSVFIGNGDGSFEPGVNAAVGDWAVGFAGGDFDDDGDTDLAVGSTSDSTVRILLSDGDGTFTEAPAIDLGPLDPEPEEFCGCVEAWSLAAGDVDGDGREDIVFGDRYENWVGTILSLPGGGFDPLAVYPTGNGGNPISVALGDLNADGLLDVVTADYLSETATVMAGDGKGGFSTALETAAGELPQDVVVAEMGGDGKPDLLFADQGWSTGQITLVPNAGEPAISLSPNPIDFGNQAQQTVSAPRAVTVTNTGDATLHVTGALPGGKDAADFLVGLGDCAVLPVLAGQSCELSVRFVPGAAGPRAGSAVVLSDAGGLPAVQLDGTGTALPQGPAGSPGAAGPAGPQGPAGKDGAAAPLILALAQKKLNAVAGRRAELSFATTLPGKATLTVAGGPTVRKTLKTAGTGTLGLKLAKPGTYNLKLAFRAGDGQRRTVGGKVVVRAP